METIEYFIIAFFIMIGFMVRHFTTIYQSVKLRNSIMRKNEAVAKIFSQSRKIFKKKIDLNQLDFDYGTSKYKIDSRKIIFEEGCPVLCYRDDDTNPIDPTKVPTLVEVNDPKENPKILQEQSRNIFSLIAAQLMNEETKTLNLLKILCLATVGVSALTLLILWGASGGVNECNAQILAVKSLVNATHSMAMP